MKAPSGATLVADGLRYAYPVGPTVIDDVAIEIRPRRRHVLLGGNGSGKSTLLLLLNGSLRPAAGSVELGGRVLGYRRAARNAHRRRVGLVFQDPDDQLFSASVREEISFGPLNLGLSTGEAGARVDQVLAELGLTDLADRPAHLLSYGQRKRVAIAGVAAMTPEIVLLDEPLAGLDPAARVEVLATLDRLEAAGSTIAITTHDVDLALAWGDQATVLDHGRVVADGPAVEVLADPEALAATRLRPPAVVTLAASLRSIGVLGDDDRPRSPADLEQLIRNSRPGPVGP
ncbi:MAG: ABC transporter ATP-binding protein [Actinomycetota bacterium]